MMALWNLLGLRGTIAAAAVFALFVVMLRADAISNERDTQELATRILAERLVITKNSLAECEQSIAEVVADGMRREDRLSQASAAQLQRSQELREEAKRILEAGGIGQCRTPPSILNSRNL